MQKILLIFMMLAGAGAVLPAADGPLVLTEDMAVDLALGQNLSLQSTRLDLETTREAVKNGWNVFLPTFSASPGISRSQDILTDNPAIVSDSWGVSASLNADLSLNSSAPHYIKTGVLTNDNQEFTFETERDALIVSVKKQFFYLIAYKENLDLQEKNLDLAGKRYEQALVNFQNGLSSELTVLEAKSSFESLKPTYSETKASYATKLMSLKSLLGLDLEKDIQVKGTLDVSQMDFDASSLIDTFMMNRLDIQMAMKNVELQKSALSIARTGNQTPTLSVSADWKSSASDLSDPEWYDSASLSLALKVPLNAFIPGSSEKLEIREAERKVKQAENSLEDTIDNAEQDIRTILMNLQAYRETIEMNELNVELAQKTFEMTESAYQQGSKEVLDVEDAQNALFSANQNLLQSRYNYLAGLLDLQYALNADTDEIQTMIKRAMR